MNALLLRARLLLAAGRAAEAEVQARELLTGAQKPAAWIAGIVVTKALRAQHRDADAQAFMSEQGLDEYELDETSTISSTEPRP